MRAIKDFMKRRSREVYILVSNSHFSVNDKSIVLDLSFRGNKAELILQVFKELVNIFIIYYSY